MGMAVDNSQEAIIAKVKALWAKGDDPGVTAEEAEAFRNKAAELMAKYEIDQFVLAAEEGGEPAIVFGQFRIDTYKTDERGLAITDRQGKYVSTMMLSDERMALAGVIARQFECRGIVHSREDESADLKTGKPIKPGQWYECIGYAHDYEMVRGLYMELVVDMLDGIFGETVTNANYQREYAQGFVVRINERLKEFWRRVQDFDESTVSSSVALAIRSRLQKVQDEMDKKYPPKTLGKVKISPTKYDANARARGRERANGSDIGQTKVGSGESARKALGQ
jgi:hypothetical protein